MLLENWLLMEQKAGSDKDVQDVKAKFPKRVKKRRKVKVVDSSTGQDVTAAETAVDADADEGWEEYFDYVFPDDGPTGPAKNLKILQMAHKWKENAA